MPPLNLVGDFGGGGMLLAFGVACALLEAQRSGRGQVVDAAMVDGAALLAAMFCGLLAAGQWSEERGVNILDTGAPWYDVYETQRRQVRLDRRDRGPVLSPSCSRGWSSTRPAAAARPRALAGRCASASPTTFKREDARRVVPGLRGLGRLLRAGAVAGRRRGAHPHNRARSSLHRAWRTCSSRRRRRASRAPPGAVRRRAARARPGRRGRRSPTGASTQPR